MSNNVLKKPENPEILSNNVLKKPENPEILSNNVLKNPENPEILSNNVLKKPENPEILSNNVLKNPENPEILSNNVLKKPENPEILSNNVLKMKNCIIDLHYLPCIAYFETIQSHPKIIIDIGENYQKQTYRNRCKILTSQGEHTLSIPIIHQAIKMPLKEVKIDHQQKWQRTHWRTMVTNYAKSPFFMYYEHYFFKIMLIIHKER
ncbi:MAG: hypothetical protein EAZ44_10930, partial [Cytophagia bacterium]